MGVTAAPSRGALPPEPSAFRPLFRACRRPKAPHVPGRLRRHTARRAHTPAAATFRAGACAAPELQPELSASRAPRFGAAAMGDRLAPRKGEFR